MEWIQPDNSNLSIHIAVLMKNETQDNGNNILLPQANPFRGAIFTATKRGRVDPLHCAIVVMQTIGIVKICHLGAQKI